MNLVVFDLETTGVNTDRDEIIQIGAVAVQLNLDAPRNYKMLSDFEIKLKPTEKGKVLLENMKSEGFKNSYSDSVWEKEAVAPVVAMNRFSGWCRKYADILKISKNNKYYSVVQGCGYNAAKFDHPFLLRVCRDFNIFIPMNMLCWDTLQLALFTFYARDIKAVDYKLSTIAETLNVELKNAHDALADVYATLDITVELLHKITK